MNFAGERNEEVRPMKKLISLSVAAILLAGLSACGSDSSATPSDAPSTTAAAAQDERAVPDVVGMTYDKAYNALVGEDFFAKLVDENGDEWITGNPWADVTVKSTDPAAGTMSDASYVNVTLTVTQDEYAKQTETAK